MKHLLLKTIALFAVLFSATLLHAHDFEAVNEDGKTIYYKIISTTEKTCAVSYKGTDNFSKAYSGFVNIPETATYSSIEFKVIAIGDYAFANCDKLYSLTIPNSITSIGSYAIAGSSLTSVIIPNSVTSINTSAFFNCIQLKTVTIGNSVTSIGHGAFNGCKNMTSVTIPNSVINIDNDAFRECSRLTSITIPNSVTTIGNAAFYGCTGLTSVTIGNSVSSIKAAAFYECNALTEVISKIEKPFNINSNCFSGIAKLNATLYVPKGTKEAYQAKIGWEFEKIDDGLVYHQLTLTANEGGVITYNGETIENSSATFEVQEGISTTITVEPYEKCVLSSLSMNGIEVMKYMHGNTFTMESIDSDVEIVASFKGGTNTQTIILQSDLQTFCFHEDMDFSDISNLGVYIVSGFKSASNEVLLTAVKEVPAGTGVLMKGKEGNTYIIRKNKTTFIYSNLLVGTLTEKTLTSGYVLRGDGFERVDEPITISANNAYLTLPSSAHGAKRLSLKFADDETDIKIVEEDILIGDDKWYTLQGTHLSSRPTTPGIYMWNNKKILVR